jgi:hypothetical protein
VDDDQVGGHVRHCCRLHGCKYARLDCPVWLGQHEQVHPCEDCRESGIRSLEMLRAVLAGKVRCCPFCDAVLDGPAHAIYDRTTGMLSGASDNQAEAEGYARDNPSVAVIRFEDRTRIPQRVAPAQLALGNAVPIDREADDAIQEQEPAPRVLRQKGAGPGQRMELQGMGPQDQEYQETAREEGGGRGDPGAGEAGKHIESAAGNPCCGADARAATLLSGWLRELLDRYDAGEVPVVALRNEVYATLARGTGPSLELEEL